MDEKYTKNIKFAARVVVEASVAAVASGFVRNRMTITTRTQRMRAGVLSYLAGGVAAGFARSVIGDKIDETVDKALEYVTKKES